ncbi:hypothetical protein PHYSODRAFT_252665 [Phytophthora sojae]|uniref:Uncharacterized protein n=1 Tax=Phytophthora sojae (strain P6497) TaxID=1094619 RepID=G4YE22_PHYSP|nr:hypothetical protein PHYSODRAFT_252665 [Phytophthora sojae]EGZ29603.1 hypothetical protein PHYSODRAFT_252665 [Phytophthora sojae]|eukprot:XP_009516878.1 hypothetical protein PHYSODRAFT_252665 [Phytophthora sojae]
MAGAREKRRTACLLRGETTTWKAIWRELKASGWTHKLPPASSIETRRERGWHRCKDYFLGEDRVLAHYARVHSKEGAQALSALSVAKGVTSPRNSRSSGDFASGHCGRNSDSASGCGKRCGKPCFDDSCVGGGKPRNSSPMTAKCTCEMSAGVLRPRRSADASPPDTSLFGSLDEENGAVDNTADSDYDAAADQSEVCSVMSSDSEDDLNQVEDDDDPDDFGGLDSGDEPMEDDFVDEDESDVEERGCNDPAEEDEVEDEDPNSLAAISERHFAEKFLESLGGAEKVLAGDIVGKDLENLRAHATSGWSEPINPDVYEHLQARTSLLMTKIATQT